MTDRPDQKATPIELFGGWVETRGTVDGFRRYAHAHRDVLYVKFGDYLDAIERAEQAEQAERRLRHMAVRSCDDAKKVDAEEHLPKLPPGAHWERDGGGPFVALEGLPRPDMPADMSTPIGHAEYAWSLWTQNSGITRQKWEAMERDHRAMEALRSCMRTDLNLDIPVWNTALAADSNEGGEGFWEFARDHETTTADDPADAILAFLASTETEPT